MRTAGALGQDGDSPTDDTGGRRLSDLRQLQTGRRPGAPSPQVLAKDAGGQLVGAVAGRVAAEGHGTGQQHRGAVHQKSPQLLCLVSHTLHHLHNNPYRAQAPRR